MHPPGQCCPFHPTAAVNHLVEDEIAGIRNTSRRSPLPAKASASRASTRSEVSARSSMPRGARCLPPTATTGTLAGRSSRVTRSETGAFTTSRRGPSSAWSMTWPPPSRPMSALGRHGWIPAPDWLARQDASVGYSNAGRCWAQFPRATLAVLDRAGHHMPTEQNEMLHALAIEWMNRVEEYSLPAGGTQ